MAQIDIKRATPEELLKKNGYRSRVLFCMGNLGYMFKCINKKEEVVITSVVIADNNEIFYNKLKRVKLIRKGIDLLEYEQEIPEQKEKLEWLYKNVDFSAPQTEIILEENLSAIVEFLPISPNQKELKSREKVIKAKKFVELNGYTVKGFLGKGKYNIVFKCKNPEDKFVATKVVMADNFKALDREVKTSELIASMKRINHVGYNKTNKFCESFKQHIVIYNEYFNIPEVKLISKKQNIAIIETPLMEGDVYNEFCNLLLDKPHSVDYQEIKKIVITVLNVLKVLNDKGKIHFDIKPQNILVKKKNEKEKKYQVADFGLVSSAEDFNSNRKVRMNCCKQGNDDKVECKEPKKKRGRGTRAYMAPELLEGKELDINLAAKVDIYSLGVTIFKLYLIGRLHLGSIKLKIMKKLLEDLQSNNEFEQLIKDDLEEKLFLNFVKYLTKYDPKERPTLEQVLEHPFISGIKNENNY